MAAKNNVKSIDGLRALAIAAVVAYHADQNLLPGGFFGVTVFFVLAGYLCTLSVARRLEGPRGFSYAGYIGQRILRLLPSMLAVVAVTTLLCVFVAPASLAKLKTDAPWALLFVQNIHYIVNEVSYFAAAGLPSPLTHFWYLGVLMQFYLAWPLVLLFTWKVGCSRKALCAGSLVLIVASTLGMALLYDPLGDTARIYYGPDTRAAELLMGALLALATRGEGLELSTLVLPEGLRRRFAGRGAQAAYDVAGALCLAGIVVLCVFVSGFEPFAYRGGMLLTALLSAVLIGVLARPGQGVLKTILGFAPLELLGKRSFAIYLWHYPLLIVMNPATRTTKLEWWQWVLEILAILAASEVSYRLFEAGSAARANKKASRHSAAPRGPVANILAQSKPALVVEALGVICALALCVMPAGAVEGEKPVSSGLTPEELKAQAEAAAEARELAKNQTFDLSGTYFEGTAFASAVDTINSTNFAVDSETGATTASVILVGDSVPADASAEFYEIFPNGYMDAVIGRQFYVGASVYQDVLASGHNGDVVVFSLADNGWVTIEQARELVGAVDSSKKVYFVTSRCPDAFCDNNNQVIWQVASEYDNVEVIDWYTESAGHDEWFWNDGTHVRPEGAEAYVMLLRRVIAGR